MFRTEARPTDDLRVLPEIPSQRPSRRNPGLALRPAASPAWQGRLVRGLVVLDLSAAALAGLLALVLRFGDDAGRTYEVLTLLSPRASSR